MHTKYVKYVKKKNQCKICVYLCNHPEICNFRVLILLNIQKYEKKFTLGINIPYFHRKFPLEVFNCFMHKFV